MPVAAMEYGMEESRIETIEKMLSAEPDDLFLRYALAMELRKADRLDESLVAFVALMAHDPPHVPAFFMAAQQLAGDGDCAQARQYLVEGIGHAETQGQLHAASEMTEMLATLPDDPQGD